MADDRMLSDEILLGLIKANSGGGGGGTNNYNQLENQPQINGTTLSGNKSASDLGLQREVLYGATDPTGGEDGDLYLKTTSASNADVFGTPAANTGDGYEITTDVTQYGDYAPYEGFGNGIGFGKNSAGRATLIYHITSGKKYKPKSVSLCNNYDVVGGYLTANSTVISGSIDGTNWTQLATITTLTDKDESITEQISTNVFYSYFKFEILANTGYPGVKNIVLVGESDSDEDNKIDDIFYKQDGKWLKDAFAKKSELDAIKDGTNIDSFADVETALAGKQATLTFDDAPTDGSNNPVKSNGIYDALALKQDATDNSLDTTAKTIVGAINEVKGDADSLMSGLTNYEATTNAALALPENAGRNLIPMVLADIKEWNTEGVWVGNVYTINDVDYTINTNSNGNVISVTANGTASATSTRLKLSARSYYDNMAGCILSGCPSNDGNYRIRVAKVASPYTSYADNTGGDTVINNSIVGNYSEIYLQVNNGKTADNVTFYPMIRPASITDSTFVPYVPSVETRLEAVESNQPVTVISVTADGVKTYAEILEQMKTYFEDRCRFYVDNFVYQQMSPARFCNVIISASNGNVIIQNFLLASGGNTWYKMTLSTSGNSIEKLSNTVAPSGSVFKIVKNA